MSGMPKVVCVPCASARLAAAVGLFHATVFGAPTEVSAQSGIDAVVGIYADVAGRRAQGTGFLVSADGLVLTSYHNVYRSRRVDVVVRERRYNDVLIESVAPETDLAYLRLPPSGEEWPFYELGAAAGHARRGREVISVGYTRGLPKQQYAGRLTQSGFLTAEQIRDESGRPLFTVEGLDLLPLAIHIYEGQSGSPVLVDDVVIGVLCCSYGEGGALAWAIPAEYGSRTRSVRRRASEITEWPSLITDDRVNSLRSLYRLDGRLRSLLDEIHSRVDQLERWQDVARTRAREVSAAAQMLAEMKTTRLSDFELFFEPRFMPAMQAMGAAFDSAGVAESEVMNAITSAASALMESRARLPLTVLNLRQAATFNAASDSVVISLKAAREASETKDNVLRFISLMNEINNEAVPDAEADRVALLQRYFSRVQEFASQSAAGTAAMNEHQVNNSYRRIGLLWERLVQEPFDARDYRAQIESRAGYALTGAPGWVPWTPELDDELVRGGFASMAPPAASDTSLARTGFFDDGRKTFDGLAIVLIENASEVTDEFETFMRDNFPSLWARQYADLRSVTVRRARFGPHDGLVAEGTVGPLSAPLRLHHVYLKGPRFGVWVNCTVTHEGSVAECAEITASLRFLD